MAYPGQADAGAVELTAFQRCCEGVLQIGGGVVLLYHMWLSIARHIFSPENLMFRNPVFDPLLRADLWLAVSYAAAVLLYAAISSLCFAGNRKRIADAIRRPFTMEGIIFLALFLWYIVSCLVYGKGTWNCVKGYRPYVIDLAICVLIIFPLPLVLGQRLTRRVTDWVFHLLALASTCFICWVLWTVHRSGTAILPNGLAVKMNKGSSLYVGVNTNIGGAIGVSIVSIALYMIASHRGVIRWVYSLAMLPNLYAVLLTGSRSCFLGLLIIFPVCVFKMLWQTRLLQGKSTAVRMLAILAVSCCAALLFSFCKDWALRLYRAIAQQEDADKAVTQGFFHDTGRLYIWPAALRLMISDPAVFFLGMPLSDFLQACRTTMQEMFGFGFSVAHAHNQILQIGVVLGVPCMAAFTALLVRLLLRCLRVGLGFVDSEMKNAWVLPVCLLAFMVINLFEPFALLYFSSMGCLFCLFSGWVCAIDRDHPPVRKPAQPESRKIV